jgi:hypothetical protein
MAQNATGHLTSGATLALTLSGLRFAWVKAIQRYLDGALATSRSLQVLRRPARAWLVIGMTLTGCAVGPNFIRPKAPESAYSPPPQTIGTHSVAYGAEVATDWYTLFHS